MKYEVLLARSARKELEKLSRNIQTRIVRILEGFEDEPRPRGCVKLRGSKNLWRVRSGDYRIIYAIHEDEQLVDVSAVRHRSDAYD